MAKIHRVKGQGMARVRIATVGGRPCLRRRPGCGRNIFWAPTRNHPEADTDTLRLDPLQLQSSALSCSRRGASHKGDYAAAGGGGGDGSGETDGRGGDGERAGLGDAPSSSLLLDFIL